jgi:transglutaminase-like putative cysteine protease
MKLHILHQTFYRYASAVYGNANELRLTPKRSLWQNPNFFIIRVLPSTRLRRFLDLHGNQVSYFEIEEPHTSLSIESNCTIITKDRYAAGLPPEIPLESLENTQAMEEVEPFIQPTSLVDIPPEIWRAAVDIRSEEKHVFGLAQGLMRFVHENCRYVSGVTDVHTTASAFWSDKRGVCQDFAHLFLALCRSIHLPARYVSGYLYDARRTEIRGAHATHAWAEVWLPGLGWHGMDPTNNCLTHENYVVLAAGRDYCDVPPVKGSFWGPPERDMQVSVHIEERP